MPGLTSLISDLWHFQIQISEHPLLKSMTSFGITQIGVGSCVLPRNFPGGTQSVLTCVTCASVVWLVDWMNIGWVSSCPAGIVTCCI